MSDINLDRAVTVKAIDIADFTTLQPSKDDKLTGDGVLDKLMSNWKQYCNREYEEEKITGQAYTDFYLEGWKVLLGQAMEFTLAKEKQPYEIRKLIKDEELAEAQIALSNKELEIREWELINKLPVELELLEAQRDKIKADVIIANLQADIARQDLLIRQQELLIKQQELQIKLKELELLDCQRKLTCQKAITEQAQVDPSVITEGSAIDLQNKVLKAQIQGFKDDIMVKRAKMALDLWITQRTTDDAVAPPAALENDHIGVIFEQVPVYNQQATITNPSTTVPTFTSTPVTTGTVGAPYTYDVNATDTDGNPLTYSLVSSPPGMVIHSTTGIITWNNPVAGTYYVEVNVTDNTNVVMQGYSLTIS